MGLLFFSIRMSVALYFASPASAPMYFGSDFELAENKIKSYDSVFNAVANAFNTDAEVMKAIVFPEFLRYSYLSDFMESFALEHIYTNYGSSMVDFSIGECQIKPSFAEDIETRTVKNSLLKEYLAGIETNNTSISRRQRVERLKNIKWQLTYLALFVKIAGDKFNLTNKPQADKVRMLATIYNRGINISMNKLLTLAPQHSFPNGNRAGSNNPYAYGELSLLYLKRNHSY